jgi:hypothetical protein
MAATFVFPGSSFHRRRLRDALVVFFEVFVIFVVLVI